jgi:hypothetical protein
MVGAAEIDPKRRFVSVNYRSAKVHSPFIFGAPRRLKTLAD